MLTPSMMQKVTNTSPNDTKSSAEALIHAEMREDTAIQRQVADLKAAGLNPVLAATGGYTGASSAAAVKTLSSDSDKENAKTNRMGKILSAAISVLSLGFLK